MCLLIFREKVGFNEVVAKMACYRRAHKNPNFKRKIAHEDPHKCVRHVLHVLLPWAVVQEQ